MVALLDAYLARFEVAPQFDAGDVAHYLLPIPGVVQSYVVEADGAPPWHSTLERYVIVMRSCIVVAGLGPRCDPCQSAAAAVCICAGCPGTLAGPWNRQSCS